MTHSDIWAKIAALRSGVTEEEFMRRFGARCIGIAVERKSQAIIFATPEADRILGYVRGSLATKQLKDVIPTRFHERHDQHWESIWQSPSPRTMGTQEMQIFAMHRDSTEIPVEVSFDFEVIGGQELAFALLAPKKPVLVGGLDVKRWRGATRVRELVGVGMIAMATFMCARDDAPRRPHKPSDNLMLATSRVLGASSLIYSIREYGK